MNLYFYLIMYCLMRISEVGVRQRQVKRWKSRKPRCITSILSASSLTINEFAPHLIILSIGMLLAGVIYIVKKIVQNPKHVKNYVKKFRALLSTLQL